jgi:hypothetical protein
MTSEDSFKLRPLSRSEPFKHQAARQPRFIAKGKNVKTRTRTAMSVGAFLVIVLVSIDDLSGW